jgi:surface protein
MGILKKLTKEYFGDIIREEDEINIDGLDVEIVSFTDNNGKRHGRGYKPKDKDALRKLLERMIKVRGNEGNFNDIDTSDITSMHFLFQYYQKFNGDITGWDVSNVKYMISMFHFAKSFNQNIGNWDVSRVRDMNCMFCDATSFNQDISNWKFPEVTNMSYMFYGATSFNQPIGCWDISSVRNMNNMFEGATSFNQDLSKWDLMGKKKSKIFYGCPIKKGYKPKMK